jgi:hypothetical protein
MVAVGGGEMDGNRDIFVVFFFPHLFYTFPSFQKDLQRCKKHVRRQMIRPFQASTNIFGTFDILVMNKNDHATCMASMAFVHGLHLCSKYMLAWRKVAHAMYSPPRLLHMMLEYPAIWQTTGVSCIAHKQHHAWCIQPAIASGCIISAG